ncbi:hypothetical protein EDS67_22380 [candidate division KSB1 bacterium]|nr:MAG: hypothetical protein EDS67_22380 [candidate division KSB1 bacterium]MBC6947439.1 hypothetical protein [candidate division KSB1 bacterium]MCE7943729.1 hypothetical protein [Chlorobi bacterium CHB1]MDL1878469.1 hypothetical protein [Cytophagia bacterium CHB2]
MLCRKHDVLRLCVRRLGGALCLIVLSGFDPTAALRAQTACAAELAEAEQKFYGASFDQAIAMAERCLRQSGLPTSTQLRAYRLLAMAYQARGDMNQAKEAIRNLLQLASNYQPDPVQDPPRFVELVKQVRVEEQSVAKEPPALQPSGPGEPEASKKKKGRAAKWLLLGGGAGVAVIVAAVLTSGGGNETTPPPQSLPTPPALP